MNLTKYFGKQLKALYLQIIMRNEVREKINHSIGGSSIDRLQQTYWESIFSINI